MNGQQLRWILWGLAVIGTVGMMAWEQHQVRQWEAARDRCVAQVAADPDLREKLSPAGRVAWCTETPLPGFGF